MKGVILAAGKGSRLYPVTHHIAKPLLPIAGRMTLEYAFDQLKSMSVEEVCIVVGENEAEMKSAIGTGEGFGVQVSYVKQTEPKGLAHAVSFAKDFVGSDSFVLYLGDAMYDEDFARYAQQFLESGCSNLNLVKEVEDPRRFGVANLDGDRIVKLVEKPQQPESNWAMAGMYIFGPQIWEVLPDLQPSARGEYEITDAIQLLIDRGDLVLAGKYYGTWFDTGTLDSFLETSRFFSKGHNHLGPDAELRGQAGNHVVLGQNAVVDCPLIEDCVVLPGAKVTSKVPLRQCILGGEVLVEEPIERAVCWGADCIKY